MTRANCRWKLEELRELEKLYREGRSVNSLAQTLDRSVNGIQSRLLILGLGPNHQRLTPAVPQDLKTLINKMSGEGHHTISVWDIAKLTGGKPSDLVRELDFLCANKEAFEILSYRRYTKYSRQGEYLKRQNGNKD